MSFFGLTLAGKALSAFQQAENVTADNISNVNTPGASRQLAILNEAPPIVGSPGYATHWGPGTNGDGSLVAQVQRVHQDSYDTLFRGASSSQYFYSVQQDALKATQATLSEPTQGINAAYTAFQQAISTLQASPDKPDQRANVVAQTQRLVTTIANAGQTIQAQLNTTLQQTTALVTQTNTILDQIAALNGQIRASRAIGDNPNTYADQRDHLIDQLSQLLSTQTNIQGNGSTLVTVNGRALVNDTVVYHLAVPVIGTNPNGTTTLKIGLTIDANPLNPDPLPLGQGQLAGLSDLYNNKLTPYATQLDSFTNALAFEVDRITTSSYDQNGIPGVALLQPIVASKAITAGNLKVGISQASEVTAAAATTSAGTIVNSLNSTNLTLDTASALTNNPSLLVSPTAALAGTLTIAVNGVNRTFNYSTAVGGNSANLDGFVANFNAGKFGVTASFDTASQRIVFARDTSNEDAVARTRNGYTPGPSFAITDSNSPQAGIAGSLLGVIGAAGLQNSPNSYSTAAIAAGSTSITVANITGFTVGQTVRLDDGNPNAENVTIASIAGNIITFGAATANAHAANATAYVTSTPATGVVQDFTNAFGAKDNSGAIALNKLFNTLAGVPGLSTQMLNTVPAGGIVATPGQTTWTVSESVIPLQLAEFGLINPGQQLTLVNQAGQQANAVVTKIDRNTGQITFTVTNNTGAAITFPPKAGPNFTAIIAAQSQTLGQYFGNFITTVGLDTQTTITGTSTQTNLSNNLDKVRQGIDGINLDEESQNLVKYQTAYQAAAKTISILDSLLVTVITNMT